MANIDREWLRLNFENVCRFCLSEANCSPLFIESTLNESLLDAVDVLVPKIDENDGLPNCVCDECYRKMVNFVQFEATALEAYSMLASVLSTHHNDGNEHYDDVEQDLQDECNDPDSTEQRLVMLPDDEREEKGVESDTVLALEPVSNDNDHPAHTADENSTKSIKPTTKIACPVCGKMVAQLSKHVYAHIEAKHFSCEQCGKRFAHRSSLQKHLNIHRNIRNYRCEYCEQCFCDRSSLRYHLAKHRGEHQFKCELCDRQFYTSTQYNQHQNLAHRERSFRCDLCGQMFRLKHHLMAHKELHTEECAFECDVCGKRFKRYQYLFVHKRRHNKHGKSDSTERPSNGGALE